MKRIGHWIAGSEDASPSARSGEVFDPATGEVTAEVAFADAATVDGAVADATAAFEAWRRAPLSLRTQLMFDFRAALLANKDALLDVVCSEHGKVRADAEGEFQRGLEIVEFACGIPALLKGGHSENVSSDVDTYSLRQPLGVVAGITPFNFPMMVPLWMFPVALACGNAFVLKPSERDPSAGNVMAALVKEGGFP
ncbi:MAG: aldehyde dehydrogenase family protein, partial [Actinomycetota bacterium]